MDTLKLRLVFDRRKEAKKPDQQGHIEIYVYDSASRKNIYISTGVRVQPHQFRQAKGEIGCIVKHPNAVSLSGVLERTLRDVEAYALSTTCTTLEQVKSWNSDVKSESMSLISFMEDELRRRDPVYTTLTQHQTFIKRLVQFGKMKTFSDVTYANVVDFYDFLEKGGEGREKLGAVTLKKRHSMFKSYINEAINRGYMTKNPLMSVKVKKGQSKDPVYLTAEELDALKNCDLEGKVEGERLIRVKDVFVFQCLTGLAYVDLKAFAKDQIFEIDGQKVIRSNRQKTDQGYISVLLPEAIKILEKYDYDLPVISMQKYNDYLKLLPLYVVDKKGRAIIKKRLTSHVARHTCGTLLINQGVPLETVARVLGHSNTKMTRHYARLLGKTVVNDIVSHVLNGNKKSPE